jgi:predicted CDP-diglyceride synthetase/phosphatidate cytidylyltransferase
MLVLLKRIWEWWKRVALVIGVFQTKLILTLFYFAILSLFAVPARLFSDPLLIKKGRSSWWFPRTGQKDGLEDVRRQF